MAVASAMKQRYDTAIRDDLRKQFGFKNTMQIPRLEKIVVNIGMGEAIGNAKAMDAAAGDLAQITGQRPVVTKSRRAISNFKLRIGMPIGLKVTLRGERMWHFYEKLVTVALPRIRDFQGIPDRSFDGLAKIQTQTSLSRFIVGSGFIRLGQRFRMKAHRRHPYLARSLASASSAGISSTWPESTSSTRRSTSASHARRTSAGSSAGCSSRLCRRT